MTDAQHGNADGLISGLISRSHRAIEPFDLVRPESLGHAAEQVAGGAWAHGGGIDIAQRLRDGERAAALVPLGNADGEPAGGLAELFKIELRGDVLFVGAAVTHQRIGADLLVNARRPDLAAAWRQIGNVRIRAAGTLGGNLMAFDPSYDAAPILAVAGAVLLFAAADGSLARCSVADRQAGELLLGCEIPLAGRVVYDRSLKPVASVAVGDSATAVGCAYADTLVVPAGAADPEVLRAALADLPEPLDDAFGSAAYRRRAIGVLVERCLRSHSDGHQRADSATEHSPAAQHIPTRSPSAAALPPISDESVAHVQLKMNGQPFSADAPVAEMLVDTITARAGLGGTRVGCDQAVCGACTVLVDGTPTASCSTFSWQAHGRDVHTIEGASVDAGVPESGRGTEPLGETLRAVQQAFAQMSAFQCGYCTPGMILTTAALLVRDPEPDRATICDWIDSNICRCTGYQMVIEAIEQAAADSAREMAGP